KIAPELANFAAGRVLGPADEFLDTILDSLVRDGLKIITERDLQLFGNPRNDGKINVRKLVFRKHEQSRRTQVPMKNAIAQDLVESVPVYGSRDGIQIKPAPCKALKVRSVWLAHRLKNCQYAISLDELPD